MLTVDNQEMINDDEILLILEWLRRVDRSVVTMVEVMVTDVEKHWYSKSIQLISCLICVIQRHNVDRISVFKPIA